jgi:sugar lactone lactonase YvrE
MPSQRLPRPAAFWALSSLALALLLGARPAVAGTPLATDELVVADDGAVAVLAIDPQSGAIRTVAAGGYLVAPHGVAVDPATLHVFVADRDAGPGGLGAVVRIDPAGYDPAHPTANQVVVASGGQLDDPSGIVVERSGTLLVSDAGGLGGVIRVDPTTGAQTRVFDFASATGLAVDLGGRIYVTRSIGANELRRFDPASSQLDLVSASGFFDTVQGLAFEPDGTLVVVDYGAASALDGQVVRVDPALFDSGHPDANQSLLSDATNLVDPRGIAVDALGRILVTDPAAEAGAGAVYRVDPTSGSQTLLATGAPLTSPIGIAVARPGPRSGDIAVAASDRVLLVDGQTGAQRLVRTFEGVYAVDIEIDANGDLLVLGAAPLTGHRVLRVDPRTGLTAVVNQGSLTGTDDFNVVEREIREGSHLFVGDSATFVSPTFDTGAIFDVDLTSGTKTLFTGGGSRFRVLAIGLAPGSGDFVVATTNPDYDSFDLVRVDRTSHGRAVVTTDGDLDTPNDLVVAPNGSKAYVAVANAVLAVDLGTSQQSFVTQPGDIVAPLSIALDADGKLLVGHNGAILRVDPVGGGPPQPVSSGGLLGSPLGLAVFVPEPDAAAVAGAVGVTLGAIARRRRRRGARA